MKKILFAILFCLLSSVAYSAVSLLQHTPHYQGLSTDTKPTTGVLVGAVFFETDSKSSFTYDGSAWGVGGAGQTISLSTFQDDTNSTITSLPGDTGGADHIYTGSWFDTTNYAQFVVTLKADQQGNLYVERSADGVNVGKSTLVTDIIDLGVGQRFADSPSAKYLRLRFVNGVVAQSVFRLRIRYSTTATGFDFSQLKQIQTDDTMVLATRANVAGKRFDGVWADVPLDNGNLLRVNSFPYTYAIAEGDVPSHSSLNKFGRNGSTLTTQTLVSDLAQAAYPYLTAAETLQTVSSDVDDQGLLLSSGSATGGTTTTLIDTGATFSTDTVATGDMLINDTKSAHGVISTVTETTLTVNAMHNGSTDITNEAGDTYRVATANDTGAAVISLIGLDSNYDEVSDHIIMNGQTDVVSTKSFIRIFRARVHLAGSSATNEGSITIQNNASLVNLAQIGVLRGQTLMAQWTVPNGKEAYITTLTVGELSNKGSEFSLLARPQGEAFQVKDVISLIGSAITKPYVIPLEFAEKTDLEVRVISGQAAGIVTSGFDGWFED